MATNDFLTYATAGGANVDTQAAYLADPNTLGGRPPGVWPSLKYNKTARQATFVTSCLGNFINAQIGQNVVDNGNQATFVSQLAAAIANVVGGTFLVTPQGRLTLTGSTPIINGDVLSATTIFYTAYTGDLIPLWNGAQFTTLSFAADLSLALTAAIAVASGIYDIFAFNNGGTLQIGIGPLWSNSSSGTSARGSGAGTTQIALKNGIWTNAVAITLKNGASTFGPIAANQATYLGSLWVDTTAGQVSCHVSWGQSRKFGVWNAYNRQPIILRCGDNTASWTNALAIRPINNNAANSLNLFTGLADEWFIGKGIYSGAFPASAFTEFGYGLNSTTVLATDIIPQMNNGNGQLSKYQLKAARFGQPPALGLNNITFLENASGATMTVNGGIANCQLSFEYNG